MPVIVPLLVRKTFRPMVLIMALFRGGYSVGMPGPVPGLGGPSPRFSPEVCQFVVNVVVVVVAIVVVVVVVVAWWLGLTFRPILLFRGGYSVGMPVPVPGFAGPSPRPSLGFFGLELRKFVVKVNVVVVDVAWWVGRGGAFRAVAGETAAFFYGRHREMAAVLAVV